MKKAVVFDLDGTILDTLPDIVDAVNQALKETGYGYRFSLLEARNLIGDGTDTMVRRALKEKGNDDEAFRVFKAHYMKYYESWQNLHTGPFDGLVEVLRTIKEKGIKEFVLTNKPDKLAKLIVPAHFGETFFDGIYGIKDGDKVKPDITALMRILNENDLSKDDVLYVGDSGTDLLTARNGGLSFAFVSWGYATNKEEVAQKADFVIEKPGDLYSLVLGKKD